MKLYFLLALIFFQISSTEAQQRTKKIIHAGESLYDYFTYRFPSYEEATMLFKNGGVEKYKMNFNMLFYSMYFINAKGDTVELSKPGNVDSILFNNSTFFFKDDFFEVLAASNPVKLVVSRKASVEPIMLGAMGLPARNTKAEGVDAVDFHNLMTLNLRLNMDIYIYGKIDYFLIGNDGEFMKPTKSNFLKVFNVDKKGAEDFLKMNKINFNRQDDLEKFFHFCAHT